MKHIGTDSTTSQPDDCIYLPAELKKSLQLLILLDGCYSGMLDGTYNIYESMDTWIDLD